MHEGLTADAQWGRAGGVPKSGCTVLGYGFTAGQRLVMAYSYGLYSYGYGLTALSVLVG